MNLVVDESVDRRIVDALRQDGHNVLYVSEFAPSIVDQKVLDLANRNDALLVTEDKDFGELVFRNGQIHTGVVLIRLSGLSAQAKARNVLTIFANQGTELLNAFSVISPGRVRVRRHPNSNRVN